MRLVGAHDHCRGGTVIDAGGVAGGHRAVLGERRAQLAHALDGGAEAGILVGVDHHVTLAGLDRHRCDLVLEPAGLDRFLGLVLRGDCEGILLFTGELPLQGDILGGLAHVVAVEGVGETVLDHGVGHLERAHLGAIAEIGNVWCLAHALLAAGNDDAAVTVLDRLAGHRHRLEPRAAEDIDAIGGNLHRHAGIDRRLAGRILPLPGGEDLAHDQPRRHRSARHWRAPAPRR